MPRPPAARVPPKAVVEAAGKGDRAALEKLLARGADLNASWRNYRALHALIQEQVHGVAAADAKRVACLEWLLEHGADPEAQGAWPPASALVVACHVGEQAYVDALLAGGARRDPWALAALGDLAGLKRALAREPGLAQARQGGVLTLLQCAAGSKLDRADARLGPSLVAIMELLLDAGADPNALTRSWSHDVDAAYFAVSSGDLKRLELLLARGADRERALVAASWKAPSPLAEACLDAGARPDLACENGRPILNELVRWGQFEPALWLIERGASPNVPDERGWTALHQAASRGSARMLRACLAAGGNLRATDLEGRLPIDVASARQKAKLMSLLVPPTCA